MNNYWKIMLSNTLMIISLIPMVIILNSCIALNDNPVFWIVVAIISLMGISYIQSRRDP